MQYTEKDSCFVFILNPIYTPHGVVVNRVNNIHICPDMSSYLGLHQVIPSQSKVDRKEMMMMQIQSDCYFPQVFAALLLVYLPMRKEGKCNHTMHQINYSIKGHSVGTDDMR